MLKTWHTAAGARALVQAWGAVSRGEPLEVPPVRPAHLQEALWRFSCECGTPWTARADAVLDRGVFTAPKRQCLMCHAWVPGHLVP